MFWRIVVVAMLVWGNFSFAATGGLNARQELQTSGVTLYDQCLGGQNDPDLGGGVGL